MKNNFHAGCIEPTKTTFKNTLYNNKSNNGMHTSYINHSITESKGATKPTSNWNE